MTAFWEGHEASVPPEWVAWTKEFNMKGKPRLFFFARHFSEYSTRMVEALAPYADILFVVDRKSRLRDCDSDWFRAATEGVRVMEFRSDSRIQTWLWTPFVLARCLQFQPDLIHMHEQQDPLTALIASIFARRTRLVLTVHDPKSHMGRDAQIYVDPRNYRRRAKVREATALFHVHGEYCRRLLLDMVGDARPITATHHGIVQEPPPGEERDAEPGRILFFGRMEEYKGAGVLMDAFDRLNARGRNYTLVLAGDGPALDQERAKRTKGVVLMNRFIARHEAIAELQKASLVALPYLEATQSGVAAAAIANGRAMVASDVGGLSDVIRHGENGLLVPAADPDKLADAIDLILQDPSLLAELSEGARKSRQELSWGKIATTLSESYSAVLDRRVNHADTSPDPISSTAC